MTQDNRPRWMQEPGPGQPEPVPEVDLATTIRAVRAGLARQWRLIAGLTVILTLAALLFIITATPKYTARAALVVDPRISNSLSGPESPTLLLSDALVVDSELKVLSSREVTTRAARDLGLFEQTSQAEAEAGPLRAMIGEAIDWLRATVASPQDDAPPEISGENAESARREAIRRELMQDFEITRDGGTYVIDIAYASEDPVFAMQAVNTLIDAYFQVSSDASLSDTRRISGWLERRVKVMANEVQAADLAVANYRRQNELFTVRDDILPSQAELSDASDRLIRLRSDLIEIDSKQEKIARIVEAGTVAALMDGTLGGDVASLALRDFQTRYATLIAEERDLTGRFGAASDVVARNREDQEQLRSLMLEEAAQIAERLASQRDSVAREIEATEAQVEELRARTNSDAEKSIRLRELERDADAKREQYGSMLQEMISATQRETFQRAPARVIARAVPPDEVSSPKARRLLILTLFGGLVLGSALGFLREVMDDRLRRIADLRDGLGLRWLGFLPGLPALDGRGPSPAALIAPPARGRRRDRAQANATLRALLAELQQHKPEGGALVTGIGSSRPAEGRAALAGWLGQAIRTAGDRVILLDLEPGGSLSAHLSGVVRLGLPSDVAMPDQHLPRIRQLWQDGETPVLALDEGADLLVPEQQRALRDLVAVLRPDLDHLLLILPPLSDRAEAEVAAALTDAAILALRWGDTALTPARQALQDSVTLRTKLIGAVFTADEGRGFARYNR